MAAVFDPARRASVRDHYRDEHLLQVANPRMMDPSEQRLTKRAPWKILASRYAIDRPFLKLRADRVELPDGTIVDEYYVQESRGYSVVFAITLSGEIVLVRQYKHGLGCETLELPAGGIDAGETPAQCAVRELSEETGYVGDAPEHIGDFATNSTGSNGRFYLYLIRNAEQLVEQHLDPTEDITVTTVPFETLLAMVRDGRIDGNSHVLATMFILDRINRGELSLLSSVP